MVAMPNKPMPAIWGIPCALVFLLAACGGSSPDGPELSHPKAIVPDMEAKEELPAIPSNAQLNESAEPKAKTPENLFPDLAEGETARETAIEDIEWGQEISLAEMIAKAKSGKIREIQWHVMPNILRAQGVDDRIFHLRNENKGVDLRNTLIGEGVQIGEGGIVFRHVF